MHDGMVDFTMPDVTDAINGATSQSLVTPDKPLITSQPPMKTRLIVSPKNEKGGKII